MSEHPHLSIGEVLSLLQDEFPDMTISKIRFLESQGLLDPERTPSGYRKFYEQDLARLRWILTQQRDHFLPLKVIKDRLDGGFEPGAEAPPASAANGTSPSEDAGEGGERRRSGATASGAGAPPSVLATRTGRRGDAPEGGEAGLRNGTSGGRPSGAAGPPTGARPDHEPGGEPERAGGADRVGAPTGELGAWSRQRREPGHGWSPAMAGGADHAEDVTGVSLSLGELASASGCEVDDIRELERFGIVVGQRLGPDVVYGDDALRAAQLAARFRRHGIEARHLRQYRMAVDKELALFEQVVAPLLRQRDRGVGGRAGDTLAELADLGEALHRVLVRRALRDYLGGE